MWSDRHTDSQSKMDRQVSRHIIYLVIYRIYSRTFQQQKCMFAIVIGSVLIFFVCIFIVSFKLLYRLYIYVQGADSDGQRSVVINVLNYRLVDTGELRCTHEICLTVFLSVRFVQKSTTFRNVRCKVLLLYHFDVETTHWKGI